MICYLYDVDWNLLAPWVAAAAVVFAAIVSLHIASRGKPRLKAKVTTEKYGGYGFFRNTVCVIVTNAGNLRITTETWGITLPDKSNILFPERGSWNERIWVEAKSNIRLVVDSGEVVSKKDIIIRGGLDPDAPITFFVYDSLGKKHLAKEKELTLNLLIKLYEEEVEINKNWKEKEEQSVTHA